MHEIAVTATLTSAIIELTAAGLAEVSHGAELTLHSNPTEPALIDTGAALRSLLLVGVHRVHVADHMLSEICADGEVAEAAELRKEKVKIFIELTELLRFRKASELSVPRAVTSVGTLSLTLLIVSASVLLRAQSVKNASAEQMFEAKRGRESRGVVLTRTRVTVTASSDFEVERAVHLVFLSSCEK